MQGEYRGDFTRDTFRRAKHLSRVLIQQGRVQLDADWNEQTSILLHYLQTLAKDLIGPYGGPPPGQGGGFMISSLPGVSDDFGITAGRYYVDGILCELEATPVQASVANNLLQMRLAKSIVDGVEFEDGQWIEVLDPTTGNWSPMQIDKAMGSAGSIQLKSQLANSFTNTKFLIRRLCTFQTQSDLPDTDSLQSNVSPYVIYLDVWERHLTYLDDARIREVALGGPDTASRAKIVWQVRVTPASANAGLKEIATPNNDLTGQDVDVFWNQYVTDVLQPTNRGLLKAQVQPQEKSTDPCITSPASAYRGAENQLYRVEIHSPGTNDAAPTFKWSRENGSVVFSILKLATSPGATTVTLASLGRDERLSLKPDDWVEVVDDDSSLSLEPNNLLQVQSVDAPNRSVTLRGSITLTTEQLATKHPQLRRWEGTGDIVESDGTDDSDWTVLEDGVEIQFQPSSDPAVPQKYRPGDYWLIPARVATGDIEWPRLRDPMGNLILDPATDLTIPEPLPPHGVDHHYAPLAILNVPANGSVTIQNAPFGLVRIFSTQAT